MARAEVSLSLADYDEAGAIQRMLDDGAPSLRRVRRQTTRSVQLITEPPPEERAALRRAARLQLRVYCLACGRSAEVPSAPAFALRCSHCRGTLLVEPTVD
jgi:hypothetical protein